MRSRIASAAGATSTTRRTDTVEALAGLLTVGIIVMIQAGGLVSNPLHASGFIWPVYLGLVALAVLLVATTQLWRSPSVMLFLLFWVILGAWMPYAIGVAPDAGLAGREAVSLGYCSALSIAALLTGRRAGLHWWRIGWLLGLLLVGSIGMWELVTGDHLWVTRERPFPFRGRVAVATYINPNNFGIVLLSMIVALLAWRAETCSAIQRFALTIAALWATALILLSESRSAVLGLVLIGLLEIARRLSAHPGLVRSTLAHHRRAAGAISAVLLATIVASFSIPSIALRNPVLRMLHAAVQPETAESDLFRVRLSLLGLRYWRESGFLGTGAGSFEPIMWSDPASGIHIEANLHNAFVEMLMQYGIIVFAVFSILILVLFRAILHTHFSASIRPRLSIVRTEMIGHLLVFVALGFTASSSLALPVWWLMLANACACAAVLRERVWRRRPTPHEEFEHDVDQQLRASDPLARSAKSTGRDQPAT